MPEKINDIIAPSGWVSNFPVDLSEFFPKKKVKAIFLSQKNRFSDLYSTLSPIVRLAKTRILKIWKSRNNNISDIFAKTSKLSIMQTVIMRKKTRFFLDPINIIEPLPKLKANFIDARIEKPNPSPKIYPDIYLLPPPPIRAIKKIYKKNRIKIRFVTTRTLKWSSIMILSIWSLVFAWFGYKNYMETETVRWYQSIYAMKWIRDPKELFNAAKKANSKFKLLNALFFPVNLLGNNPFYSNNEIKKASNAIWWAISITEAAMDGSKIWSDSVAFINNEKNWVKMDLLETLSKAKITDFISFEKWNINNLKDNIESAIFSYSQIDSLWNPALDQKFQKGLDDMIKAEWYLKFMTDNMDTILELLWDKKPTRYLILNQNKDEIRASWWFPWSVITLELYKWAIVKYDKKDIYYYDWHLTPYKETPPEWLNIISPNHWLRDANYYPVFLESAKKINFFYEKSWWGTIDTVIAINQWVIEEILKKYWAIKLDEINTEITDKNFSLLMSILVENKFQKVISPKDILFKFSEKLEQRLIDKMDLLWYVELFLSNLNAWEIEIASLDKSTEDYLDSLNIFDKWRKDEWNWIYPVFTSISWNKSDRYMQRDFKVTTQAAWNCQALNHFSLVSKHTYNDSVRDSIRTLFDELKIDDWVERDRLIWIQWAAENRQFVRVLTPKWSKLLYNWENSISVDNSDPSYTFFKFYVKTDVWSSNKIEFDYSTDVKNCNIKPVFYKQPWLSNYTFSTN